MRARFAVALAFLALSGCATPSTLDGPLLPFHVAVIPMEVLEQTPAPSTSEPDLVVAYHEPAVSEAVRAALDGRVFSRASALAYPEDIGRDAFLALPRVSQDDHWVSAARAAGADLVLAGALEYDPNVASRSNDRFWLNLPLFLIGGPAVWFVDDRSYHLNVRLRTSFYDLSPINDSKGATLQNSRSRLLQVSCDCQRVDLDLVDRASGDAAAYGLSMVMPSGLVSPESKAARACIERESTASLMRDLSAEVVARAEELIQADRIVDFFLRPEDSAIVDTAGTLEFVGTVVLRLADTDRMGSCRAFVRGTRVFEGQFEEGLIATDVGRERKAHFALRVPLPDLEDGELVRLEIEDGSRSRNVRSFTFACPDRLDRRP